MDAGGTRNEAGRTPPKEHLLTATLSNKPHNEDGFTLIELLVVILIIGILAAIAIPSFLNQREKGQDACAKTMVRTMQTAMETYYTDYNSYTSASPAALKRIENQIPTSGEGACGSTTSVLTGNQTPGNYCNGDTPGTNNYCIFVESANGHWFRVYRSTAGEIHRNCEPAGSGGCPASGRW